MVTDRHYQPHMFHITTYCTAAKSPANAQSTDLSGLKGRDLARRMDCSGVRAEMMTRPRVDLPNHAAIDTA